MFYLNITSADSRAINNESLYGCFSLCAYTIHSFHQLKTILRPIDPLLIKLWCAWWKTFVVSSEKRKRKVCPVGCWRPADITSDVILTSMIFIDCCLCTLDVLCTLPTIICSNTCTMGSLTLASFSLVFFSSFYYNILSFFPSFNYLLFSLFTNWNLNSFFFLISCFSFLLFFLCWFFHFLNWYIISTL